MSEDEDQPILELDELPNSARVVTILALILAILGLGYAALSVTLSVVSFALLGSLGGAPPVGPPMEFVWASGVLQMVGQFTGGLLSVGVIASSIAAFGRRLRPLTAMAVLCIAHIVFFGVLVYVGLGLASLGFQFVALQSLPMGGIDPLTSSLLILLPSVLFMVVAVVFAAARVAFWVYVLRTLRQATRAPADA